MKTQREISSQTIRELLPNYAGGRYTFIVSADDLTNGATYFRYGGSGDGSDKKVQYWDLDDKKQEIIHPLSGKNIAVIGDSISTIANNNTPYWTIMDIDVGHQIEVYISWLDVYKNDTTTSLTNKTIGGVTLTQSMIGTKQTFTPVAEDVGKEIGVKYNYNGSGTKVWSQALAELTNSTLIANSSWSGSSMCSGQSGIYTYTHGYSQLTVGSCRVRDDEGNFINPDVIFIYRGTNDMTHGQTGGYSYLDDYDLAANGYPSTDLYYDNNAGGNRNGFRRAYYMTIKALRDAYPYAMIYCCTLNVFKRVTHDRFPTRNNLYSLPEINKVIREIADKMGCGLVDFEKDGITFENCYPKYISDSSDSPTHPNSTGHMMMAKRAMVDTQFVM